MDNTVAAVTVERHRRMFLALASAVANRSIEAAPADDAPKGKR